MPTINDAVLNDALITVARVIRERMEGSRGAAFNLDIKVTGSTIADGPVKITYALANDRWGSHRTEGTAINPVLDEFIRRIDWAMAQP